MKKIMWLLLVLSLPLALISCQTVEPEQGPTLYEKYDVRVQELERAVARGEITVSEAETMRQEAFRDYLEENKQKRLKMAYRNY